jgi:UDP-3-O-acyl-N-acetylglucosamine deacetylase
MTTYVDRQTTLADQVTLTGLGVHSGKPVSITLVPAETGVGIVFTRTDKETSSEVPALNGTRSPQLLFARYSAIQPVKASPPSNT